jgi:hypothetical protein
LGTNAMATQSGSIAVGYNASSTGANAIAIGTNASATGSVAVGNGASAALGGAAFGDKSVATASNSAALGTGATATAANSVALGTGSVANEANTVSVGSPGSERRITNVAAGTAPTDAVNYGQLESGLSNVLSQANNYTDMKIAGVNTRIDLLQRKSFSGIASAISMEQAPMPSAGGKTTFAMHAAVFENYTGLGVSFAHRFDTELPFAVDGSFSHSAGEDLGRVGFEVEF